MLASVALLLSQRAKLLSRNYLNMLEYNLCSWISRPVSFVPWKDEDATQRKAEIPQDKSFIQIELLFDLEGGGCIIM